MSRIKPLETDKMTDDQRRVSDIVTAGPRGRVPPPIAAWLPRPELCDRAQSLGLYCRFDNSMPDRLSELAILVMMRFWDGELEWFAHKPLALKAGVSADLVEAIRTGQTPKFDKEDERLTVAFITALNTQKRVPDALYKETVAALGEGCVIDLVGVLGYYTLIAMTLQAFKIGLPEGVAAELT